MVVSSDGSKGEDKSTTWEPHATHTLIEQMVDVILKRQQIFAEGA